MSWLSHSLLSSSLQPAAATKNDTAIALVLQNEENDRGGQASLPTTHATCTSDFEIARRLQQEFDAEIACALNHRERGMYSSNSDSDTNGECVCVHVCVCVH